jgi:endonuclease/exonuclease/phosphatase (EEP) superfamily protein YafD
VSRIIGRLAVLALAAAAVLGTVVDHLGLTTTTPIAQLLALRGLIGLASVGLALLLGLVVALRRAQRPGRPAAAVLLVVVLAVTGAIHVGTVAARGVVDSVPTTPATTPGSLTVLTLNTLDGASAPEAVADAVFEVAADVVVLPETPESTAQLVADLLGARAMPMQVFTDDPGFRHRATSMLVSEGLGEYAATSAPEGEGFLRVDPVTGTGPALVAVHARRPGQGSAQGWVSALERAVTTCRQTPGVVVAGDFNATLDHGPMRRLGRCGDAAAAGGLMGAGAFGTWHAAIPALLGAPIDHVLVDEERWEVSEVGVAEIGASDHRAVLARLVPRVAG